MNRRCGTQPYLCSMYKAIFCLAFYRMMHIGELTQGNHPVKACDIHIRTNKDKILIVLYTSKTHDRSTYLQQIKISSDWSREQKRKTSKNAFLFFCPFAVLRQFLSIRGSYLDRNENFFFFSDKSPVKPDHVHRMLHGCLKNINIDPKLYNCHSFRISCVGQLLCKGTPIKLIKQAGRWKSNAIYRYLRY